MQSFKVNGRKVSALIATPCRLDYNTDAELVTWNVNQIVNGVAMGWKFVPSRTAEDGRNEIIRWMLGNCPEATHVMFMDSDTIPDGDGVLQKMFRHSVPIVAGMTPVYYRNDSNIAKLNGKFRWNVLVGDQAGLTLGKPLAINEIPSKPFYASSVGGTTILIRRDVLVKVGDPWFVTERELTRNDIVCGEDFYFCLKARKAGYKILIDPSIQCHHRQYLDLLEIIRSIKAAATDPDYWKQAEAIDEKLRVFGATVPETEEVAA